MLFCLTAEYTAQALTAMRDNPTTNRGEATRQLLEAAGGKLVSFYGRVNNGPGALVIFDIDPEFNNTEEWWLSIPEEVRPHKDQPFYHLLAENSETEYVAYVSEQNLLPDDSGEPIRHSQVAEIFVKDKSGGYRPRNPSLN